MPLTQDEIYERVKDVLVDALAVEPEDVTPEAILVDDLDAESIDFLDIGFKLEGAFKDQGLKIDQQELFPANALNDEEYVKDGKITDKGMNMLRDRMPHADVEELDGSRDVNALSKVFTVEAVVKFVQARLDALE